MFKRLHQLYSARATLTLMALLVLTGQKLFAEDLLLPPLPYQHHPELSKIWDDATNPPHSFEYSKSWDEQRPTHHFAQSRNWDETGHTFKESRSWEWPPYHKREVSGFWPPTHSGEVSRTWKPHQNEISQYWPPDHSIVTSVEKPPPPGSGHDYKTSKTMEHIAGTSLYLPRHDSNLSAIYQPFPPANPPKQKTLEEMKRDLESIKGGVLPED